MLMIDPPPSGDLRGERGDQKERRLDVDLEQTIERRLVSVNRRSEGGKAGTVDQDIDLACRVGDAPHLGHLREIRGDELRTVTLRADFLCGALAAGLVAAGEDHRRALLGHRPGGGDPHPGGATGDQSPFVRQIHCRHPFNSWNTQSIIVGR
jgi:hypothetical protein